MYPIQSFNINRNRVNRANSYFYLHNTIFLNVNYNKTIFIDVYYIITASDNIIIIN